MRISDWSSDVCSSDLNQRETVVAWDKRTGEPLGRAIVWQDRRTAGMCAALKNSGHEAIVQAKTGLLLDPYFSATKMRWMLQNQREVREAGERLALGTVESYLIYRLTGGLHVTDARNESRTLLMPLEPTMRKRGGKERVSTS